MSPLTLVAAVAVMAVECSGGEGEVPLRLNGFSAEDASWLEGELGGWVKERDRSLCAARLSDEGLELTLTQLEATITFRLKGVIQARSLPRDSELVLFRYQLAAAAEELARTAWETPPPRRLTVFALGHAQLLTGGHVFIGGGVGASFAFIPSVAVELEALGASLLAPGLESGGGVTGSQFAGALALTWLPLRVGVLRAGPRISSRVGALTVSVAEDGITTVATTPWADLTGGAFVGLELGRLSVRVVGEAGFAFAGAAVLSEGVAVQRLRGFTGVFGLQAGGAW